MAMSGIGAYHVRQLYQAWLEQEDLESSEETIERFAAKETEGGYTLHDYDRANIVRLLHQGTD